MQNQRTRRRFVQLATATTVAGLAGCSSEGDTGDSASSDGGADDETTDEATDEPADDGDDTATPEPTETETEQPDVTILEHGLEEGSIGQKVVGKMENTSGEEQSYLGVEAKFYNADDERIGEGMDNATDVAAGTVVNFEILSTADEDIDSYELDASTSPF